MGDNDAAMRDVAAVLVRLRALQGGNGQNHIPTVREIGDSITVDATDAEVPNRTFMAETRYPLAVRLQPWKKVYRIPKPSLSIIDIMAI